MSYYDEYYGDPSESYWNREKRRFIEKARDFCLRTPNEEERARKSRHEKEINEMPTKIDEEKIKALKEQPACGGLGDEIDRFRETEEYLLAKKAGETDVVIARHFVQWQREQMKKSLLEWAKELEQNRLMGYIMFDELINKLESL